MVSLITNVVQKNEAIKICVSIGKIRSAGQIPVVDVLDDVDSDYSAELIRTGNTEHSPEIHMQHTKAGKS